MFYCRNSSSAMRRWPELMLLISNILIKFSSLQMIEFGGKTSLCFMCNCKQCKNAKEA